MMQKHCPKEAFQIYRTHVGIVHKLPDHRVLDLIRSKVLQAIQQSMDNMLSSLNVPAMGGLRTLNTREMEEAQHVLPSTESGAMIADLQNFRLQ
jgi:hypothetical protein